jgi:hypothetical protein
MPSIPFSLNRRLLALAAASLVAMPAGADIYMKTGLIKGIYSYSSTVGADVDHFTIEGFVPADTNHTCPSNDGLVGIVLGDDERGRRHYAMVVAAHLAGKPVRARVDNSRKNAFGMCYLWMLERID